MILILVLYAFRSHFGLKHFNATCHTGPTVGARGCRPLPGPTLETRELTVLMRGIFRVTVRILRTLRRAEELPLAPPFPPLRPLSPCPVAKRAVRGVGNRSRSPRRSRSRELELSEIGSHASSRANSPVPPVPSPPPAAVKRPSCLAAERLIM